MKYIVTADQMKEYDNNTINEIGIPSMVLMERAALAVYEKIREMKQLKKILIVAGVGNNGGDGLALARLLTESSYEVTVCIVGDKERASVGFCEQLCILEHYCTCFITPEVFLDLENVSYDCVVDSIFGVGLSREITGTFFEIIQKMNQLDARKISVDIPSGICADTGRVLGCAFRADITITFGFCKAGLCFFPGAEYAGKVYVADIGISKLAFGQNIPKLFTYDEAPDTLLKTRKKDGNKGTFGKVLVIAGFENMTGAGILCAKSALEMGAGMVKIISTDDNKHIYQTAIPDALWGNLQDLEKGLDWANIAVAGPGMGNSQDAVSIMERLLSNEKVPLVLDADALNMISESDKLRILLKEYKQDKILTPHMGELSRLVNMTIDKIKENRIEVAKSLAKEYHSVVVCKDARTIVAKQNEQIYINLSGNNGMATAGSGDVLAGIIGSLLAQGEKFYEAAAKGVYLHGLAGDYAKSTYTEWGVTASRILDNIKELCNKLS